MKTISIASLQKFQHQLELIKSHIKFIKRVQITHDETIASNVASECKAWAGTSIKLQENHHGEQGTTKATYSHCPINSTQAYVM